MKDFDKNSDGEISRYEFRDMMKALVKKQKSQNNVMRKASLTKQSSTNSNIMNNVNYNLNKMGNNNDPKLLKRSSMGKPIKR